MTNPILARVAAAAAALIAFPAASAAPASAAPCDDPDANADSDRELAGEITCLVNRERRERGLARLRQSPRLAAAARGYARWMARRDVFSHYAAGSPASRAEEAGYLTGGSSWTIGEVLATAQERDALWVVRAWLKSRSHRSVLLRRDFRDIGVGVSPGRPFPSAQGGVTIAAKFGVR